MLELIILILAVGIIVVLVKFFFKVLKVLGKGLYYVFFGPILGLSFLISKLTGYLHLSMAVNLGCFLLPLLIAKIISGLSNKYISISKYASIVFAAFVFANLITHIVVWARQRKAVKMDYFIEKANSYYRYLFASVLFFLEGCVSLYIIDAFGFLFWAFSIGTFIYTLVKEIKYSIILKDVFDVITHGNKTNATKIFGLYPDNTQTMTSDETSVYQWVASGIAQKLISEHKLLDISLLDNLWFIRKNYYDKNILDIEANLSKKTTIDEDEVVSIIKSKFGFSDDEAKDLADRYLDFGEYHYFNNKKKFVHYENQSNIVVCSSCGSAIEKDDEIDLENDWYCSEICKETDEVCISIKDRPYNDFISDAATAGIVIMAGAEKWDLNNRMFVGNEKTIHGYTAERYNDMVDKLHGKKIVPYAGHDNAPGGADRIVDGKMIQTKYHKTAVRSVGAAFCGEDGTYGYYDNDGNPIPTEYSSDQYAKSLKITEEKIKNGKVPNIEKVPGDTDAEKAKNLTIRGHAKTNQAVAMTKFGTIDSLKFDIMDGSVIALKAGGISFCISATIAYINTKNPKEALRIAVISGGKTAVKSLVIFVGAQQLHRIAVVNTLLKKVDISALPKNMSKFIKKGYGLSKTGAVNRALRGTIVTSVVVIAVTTGPDLLKMVRGRISGAQFVKNLAVATSGVAGGVVGSIIGGALLAPLGPIGMFIGRTAGGIAGGMVASQLTNKVAGKFMKDDREVMMEIVKSQIEYLAKLFMLTKDEINNLNENLIKVITNDNLERMFASGVPRAFSNFLVKPVVVSIVKQRPIFQFDEKDVIDACAEVVAA